ncbi:hypothetical protein FHX09_001262 [Rhizobium sp. BK538]|nr:hypothetical protein [Rhizobium sp. BK060]MBB4167431.1 hypothetical protein [Rhizobium sp. BK538]
MEFLATTFLVDAKTIPASLTIATWEYAAWLAAAPSPRMIAITMSLCSSVVVFIIGSGKAPGKLNCAQRNGTNRAGSASAHGQPRHGADFAQRFPDRCPGDFEVCPVLMCSAATIVTCNVYKNSYY